MFTKDTAHAPDVPGCLRFNDNSQPCSIECNPWFPPADLSDDSMAYDDGLYEQWVTGRPICKDHLDIYEQENICIIC